jgi:hypothetical protein
MLMPSNRKSASRRLAPGNRDRGVHRKAIRSRRELAAWRKAPPLKSVAQDFARSDAGRGVGALAAALVFFFATVA